MGILICRLEGSRGGWLELGVEEHACDVELKIYVRFRRFGDGFIGIGI